MRTIVFALLAASLYGRNTTPEAPRPSLVFEQNVGQTDGRAAFLARARNYTLYVRPDGSAVVTAGRESALMELIGASAPRPVETLEPTGGVSSYFLGSDPEQWRSSIPHYGRIAYRGVYPGIDVAWHASGRNAEFDFVVAPGGDPSAIRFLLRAPEQARVDANGDLVAGHFRLARPVAYQGLTPVRAVYRLGAHGTVSFQLGDYDRTRPLTIDPVVSYSTFIGETTPGSVLEERPAGGAVDGSGSFFICSQSFTATFPTTPGAYDTQFHGGLDIALSKFSANGASLAFSTYLGGPGDDYCEDVALDAAGNPVIGGWTASSNFPTTSGVLQRNPAGDTDAYIAKFNAAGNTLLLSTRVGGSDYEDLGAIAVDPAGNIFAAGHTFSDNFPFSAGSLRSGNEMPSGFVIKINATATTRIYTAMLSECTIFDLAIDAAGNAYIAGDAYRDFVTTAGAFDRTHGEDASSGFLAIQDAFAAKINPAGSALVFATFLGGVSPDVAYGVGVDSMGNVFVTGLTSSANFPVTSGAFRTAPPAANAVSNEPVDTFVSKLNPTGSALVYSTFLGGSSDDLPWALQVAADGTAWVAGNTTSSDFPRTPDALPKVPTLGNNDLFLTHLNAAGSQLLYSTAIGTSSNEAIEVLVLAANGDIYLAASTEGTAAPSFPGVTTTTLGTQPNGWVLKLTQQAGPSQLDVVSTASFAPVTAPLAPMTVVIGFGTDLASGIQTANSPWASALLGTTVKVKDSAGVERQALLVYVYPNLVSFLIPAGSANGAATVDVIRNGSVVARGGITIASVSPGFYTVTANGQGTASAIAIHVKADGTQPFELIYTCPGGTCTAVPLDLGPVTDTLIISFYGTGFRGRSSTSAVTASAGGVSLPVQYVGAQGTIDGLDQLNVTIPRTIAKGLLTLNVTVDGVAANAVQFRIQ